MFNDHFGNDCVGALINRKDYHSDDYQYFAADNLVADSAVPGEFLIYFFSLVGISLYSWKNLEGVLDGSIGYQIGPD